MSALLPAFARMSVVLGIALLALPLLRHRSAALRAWVVAAGLTAAALTPILQLVAPAWGGPLEPVVALPAATPSVRLVLIWLAGAAVQLAILAAGLLRLRLIAAAAAPIREGRCADLALAIGAEYRVHAPVQLLEADGASQPVTWGDAQPTVLLPRAARHWSDERARAVLRHELAHVRRRDWRLHVFARVVRAVYWFHPLVWVACARLRFECERACDDAVLRGGLSGTQYAVHLLALARTAGRARRPQLAPGMLGRSTLRRRVESILAVRADRSPLPSWRRAVVALVTVVAAFGAAGFGAAPDDTERVTMPPPRRLTLLLDGRIVDLAREWPTYPDPRAGLVEGPGLRPDLLP